MVRKSVLNLKQCMLMLLLMLTVAGIAEQARAEVGIPYVWGHGTEGQVGSGQFKDSNPRKLKGFKGAVQVSAGFAHTLSLMKDGTVQATGWNFYGQIGDGSYKNTSVFVPVSGLSNIVQVSAGGSFSLALRSDGTVWAWGNNAWGQLGDGSGLNSTSPVKVAGLKGVVHISAGANHALALKTDGTVWGWGFNGDGEMGDGTTNNAATPIQVPIYSVMSIAAGTNHNLVLKEDGNVWAWGKNEHGKLGDGTTDNSLSPVQTLMTDCIGISAGAEHSLALSADGTAYAWGRNDEFQLGQGASTAGDSYSPVPVKEGAGSLHAVEVHAGGYFSAALKGDGSVVTWGANDVTQLGTEIHPNNGAPARVSQIVASSLSTGYAHSFALETITATKVFVPSKNFVYGSTVLSATVTIVGTTIPRPDMAVDFSVDGVYVDTVMTDTAGFAMTTLGKNTPGGTHTVTAHVQPGNFQVDTTGTGKIVVNPAGTLLTEKSASAKAGKTVNLSATLKNRVDGSWLAGKTVTFKVAGTVVGTAQTGANGVALFAYVTPNIAPQVLSMSVSFDGDVSFLASSYSKATLTIK